MQVVSDRADKSILVAIDRWRWIPKYKKEIRRTTKLMAHDENNECRLGDLVQVESSRCALLLAASPVRCTEPIEEAPKPRSGLLLYGTFLSAD